MSDSCTCSRGCEGSSSGIGKEIQYFDRSAGVADLSENQSQLVACSGKRPVCLKLNGLRLKVSEP